MKKYFPIIFLAFLSFSTVCIKGQNVDKLFYQFNKLYGSGDLSNAEKTLILILNQKDSIPEFYTAAAYNNLGAVYQMLGKYETAVSYYDKAELFYSIHDKESKDLAGIYNNKAQIFTIQKSFNLAFEYLEKSMRIFQERGEEDQKFLQSLSSFYLSIGIAYYETKDYKKALQNFHDSEELKIKNCLSGLFLVYLNIAKAYEKSGNSLKAEEYYLKSISKAIREHGDGYLRLAEVYFDYGLFLRSAGRDDQSLEILNKALSICIKNYGEKHTLVSLSYKLIGDHYKIQSNFNKALEYYQKAMIAVVNNFNDPGVFSNPSIDSSLFDIRLLDNLKSKAQVLEIIANHDNTIDSKLKNIGFAFETMELALLLIDKIRNNYPSEASKIYLAENEKESYIFATHLAYTYSGLTSQNEVGERMYNIASRAKAAILRNEITGKELLLTAGIPDTLLERQKSLTSDIAAYNLLITKENGEPNPDESKLQLWKDALFSMSREREKITAEINQAYPLYNDLLHKTDPVSLSELQKNLGRDETMIDYLLSNQYKDGKRLLYIFLITRNDLVCVEKGLDSLFFKEAGIIRSFNNSGGDHQVKFKKYTSALSNMYENLFKPVESFFKGNNLIIIPDEEISWLPFDAFIKTEPAVGQTDYEGLSYLIYDYTFSYGYTSSLVFNNKRGAENVRKVYSFSPDYGLTDNQESILDPLRGAGREIESIYKLFGGQKYTGGQATEKQFTASTENPAIFHLAMHALTDSTDSRYSYFMFDRGSDSIDDGRLYNYEISLNRINSPMVVMSACNSGSGTLYQGEGLMSLARGFILAGASSVIKTAWDVNDEVSATIISAFYYNLSKGMQKDEALREAKLEYLRLSPPSQANPYYWAAYELMGDDSPVTGNNRNVFIAAGGCALLVIGLLIFYFRRRRIFSARSL